MLEICHREVEGISDPAKLPPVHLPTLCRALRDRAHVSTGTVAFTPSAPRKSRVQLAFLALVKYIDLIFTSLPIMQAIYSDK
jgi:hypothetical protein